MTTDPVQQLPPPERYGDLYIGQSVAHGAWRVCHAARDITAPTTYELDCFGTEKEAAAYAATNDALRLHVRNVKLRDENRRLREACRKWNERDLEHGFQPCGHPWTDIDNAVCDGFCTGCAKDDELAMEREGREEMLSRIRNAQRVGEPMGSDKPRLDPRVAEEIAKATMPEGRFASETIRAYNETQQLIANKDLQGLAEALARDARDFSETTHKSSDAINSGIPNEPELSVSQEWLDGYRHGYAESKLDTTESLTQRH